LLLPAVDPCLTALSRAESLVERGEGSFAVLNTASRDAAAEEVLRAAFAKVRIDEWTEFLDECGKYFAKIDKAFAKQKPTLGELEEERRLDRLRRWFATLEERNVLQLPEAQVASERLAECERWLNG
jgi:hypothetical protein